MLFQCRGMRVSEAIALFNAVDLTDFVVRSTGWFPSRQAAEHYERTNRLKGRKGQAAIHPYARSPPYYVPETIGNKGPPFHAKASPKSPVGHAEEKGKGKEKGTQSSAAGYHSRATQERPIKFAPAPQARVEPISPMRETLHTATQTDDTDTNCAQRMQKPDRLHKEAINEENGEKE